MSSDIKLVVLNKANRPLEKSHEREVTEKELTLKKRHLSNFKEKKYMALRLV